MNKNKVSQIKSSKLDELCKEKKNYAYYPSLKKELENLGVSDYRI